MFRFNLCCKAIAMQLCVCWLLTILQEVFIIVVYIISSLTCLLQFQVESWCALKQCFSSLTRLLLPHHPFSACISVLVACSSCLSERNFCVSVDFFGTLANWMCFWCTFPLVITLWSQSWIWLIWLWEADGLFAESIISFREFPQNIGPRPF